MVAALNARRVVKRFGKVEALRGLDLAVEEGELYGLIGPNGAGKTTLIRILMGLAEPDEGEALVLGGSPRRAKARVGYMPQEEALYGDLTVRENVEFFAGLFGPVDAARTEEALAFVRLWSERDRAVETLSGGMRRRVSLAATLVHRPRVLFLDEPTVGVDPVLRGEFWEGFRDVARRGSTILITTHHIEEARRCDRVGLLWRGRMLREGPPEALLAESGTDNLEDAFVAFIRGAGLDA